MNGSYRLITEGMKHSELTHRSLPWADVRKQMDILFQSITYYWSVLCQYRALQMLWRENINSEVPSLTNWSSAEIWGYQFCDTLYQYYRRRKRYSSEDDFHTCWSEIAERRRVGHDLEQRLSLELQSGIVSLALFENYVCSKKGDCPPRLWLRKRYRVHEELRCILRDNLEPCQKPVEESVDQVLSEYSTYRILAYLNDNTVVAAMSLQLFTGLNIIPSITGDRIEDDKYRSHCLFERSCTCSLNKAQAGIDSILAGYAYAEMTNRIDMIQYWKKWLTECDEANERLKIYYMELEEALNS